VSNLIFLREKRLTFQQEAEALLLLSIRRMSKAVVMSFRRKRGALDNDFEVITIFVDV
jgi:hypothetical protein